MNVVALASRKGGSGKSTLAAHLAAYACKPSRPTLLIDADPQGSLSLWQQLRGTGEPILRRNPRSIADAVRAAEHEGYEWVFIDTPPNRASVVVDAIRASTLVVIPARPSLFDLAAVKDTIDFARHVRRAYCVVINAAPAKRDESESPMVSDARDRLNHLKTPVWSGQITNRAAYSLAISVGQGVTELDADSLAADEIGRLWTAIDRSAKAVHGAYHGANVMHRLAA